MADEAKLRRRIHSAFEALVVWHTVRSCHGEELDPFCRPMLAAGIAVFGASHLFAEHTAQMQCFFQDSESYSGSDQQQTSKQWPWPFFGASLALENALELLLISTTELVVAGCPIKSTFHCTSQSDWEMVHCCCIELEKMTLQNDNFFVISSWGTKVFHLSNLFQMLNNHKRSISSSWGTSCVVVTGSALMILPIGHCQLLMASHCTPHLQGSCLLFKTSWTTTALYIR